jgi:hypothetical protein
MASSASVAAERGAGWRFRLGVAIFVFAFALWLLLPLAAAMGAGARRMAALTGTIFLANKVLLVATVAAMGKPGFQVLKGLAAGYVKGLAPDGPIGPVRHAIGIAMFSVPPSWAVIEPYVDQFFPGLTPDIWQLQVVGDLVLIGSFFVLGGDFWNKLRAVFTRSARPAAQAPRAD